MTKKMLEIDICGVKLKNPTILASGILGVTASSLVNVSDNGAGAVTTKSISPEERKGHKAPVIITTKNYLMNAVGLSNAGMDNSIDEINLALKNSQAPLIVSIFAGRIKEYGELAKKLESTDIKIIEVNISCPNVEDDFGLPFSAKPETASDVTRIVKKNTTKKIIIKLSPNVQNLGAIAKACEDAGADAINMGNTGGPGLAIDIKTAMPILTNVTGGISGPALKPIAIRCVWDVYKSVKIPIIGTGGVTNGHDAIEMMMAGATAVGVGSAVYYHGVEVFKKITDEMETFLKEGGYNNVKEIIGLAHKNLEEQTKCIIKK